MPDPSRSNTLEKAVQISKALGSLLSIPVALAVGYGALQTQFWDRIGAPKEWQFPLSVALAAAICLLAVSITYFFRRESRLEQPDRFVIRPVDRKSLIGRDKDVDDLKELVRFNRLVLLDGESGCGKSALVAAGVAPEMAEDPAWLPVLLRSWGPDWEAGPLGAALDALFHALGAPGRAALGWTRSPDLTAPCGELAGELAQRLTSVHATLGRRPLLVLDQFDDYQAAHRERVLGADGAWLAPEALTAANRFWMTIADALRAGAIHAVIITRDDASGGLHSVRFDGVGLAARTIRRVEAIQIRPMLVALTPDGATPLVVSYPESGWTDLSDTIARELEARGALLMQQFRVLLLGLRELPRLTVRRFRAAGNADGVEALYVRRSVEAAAGNEGRAAEQSVRALLDRLVDRGDGRGVAKTRTISEPELVGDGAGAAAHRVMLAVLADREVVRQVVQPGAGSAAWRLDHDYLARAVLADARNANRWAVSLADGQAAFSNARGSLAQQFRALLGVKLWLRICLERARGRLRFGAASRYFWLSAIRPALVVALVGLVSAGGVFYARDQEALRVANAIGSGVDVSDDLMRVWSGPGWLRNRVRTRLEATGNEGQFRKALDIGWTKFDVAWDPQRAVALALELHKRLTEPEVGEEAARTYADAYAVAAGKITDQATLKSEAKSLRDLFTKADPGSYAAPYYADAYAAVAGQITDQSMLKSEVETLNNLLTQVNPSSKAARSYVDAYVAVAGQITNQKTLKSEAESLRDLLTKADPTSDAVRSYSDRYVAVAGQITDQTTLKLEAKSMRELLTKGDPGSYAAPYYADAYAAVAGQITDQSMLKSEVETLNNLLTQVNPSSRAARSYVNAYVAVAGQITDQSMLKSATEKLNDQFTKADAGSYYAEPYAQAYAQAYAALAARISDQAMLKSSAEVLRDILTKADPEGLFSTGPYADAYAAVAGQITNQATLKAETEALYNLLTKADPRSFGFVSYAKAYATVAGRMSDQTTLNSEAKTLREIVAKAVKHNGQTGAAVVAYAAAAGQITDQVTFDSWTETTRGLLAVAGPAHDVAMDYVLPAYATFLRAKLASNRSQALKREIVLAALSYAPYDPTLFLKLITEDCRAEQPAVVCDPLAKDPHVALAWAEKKYGFDRAALRPTPAELGLKPR